MTPPEKIAEDLKKSGFASELAALQIFNNLGWGVAAGTHYLDPVEHKTREIDIIAWDREPKATDGYSVSVQLICDVKKTEKPWVLLRSSSPDELVDIRSGVNLQTGGCGSQKNNRLSIALKFIEKSPAVSNAWIAHGLHESFKPPIEHSKWYSTCQSLCRFTRHLTSIYNEPQELKSKKLTFFQPVVIVDGELFEASLHSEGTIKVNELNAGSLEFSDEAKDLPRMIFNVDIVTLSSLKSYLENYTHRLKAGLSHLEMEVGLVNAVASIKAQPPKQ